jgi:hypothetical protein
MEVLIDGVRYVPACGGRLSRHWAGYHLSEGSNEVIRND